MTWMKENIFLLKQLSSAQGEKVVYSFCAWKIKRKEIKLPKIGYLFGSPTHFTYDS